MPGDTGQSNCSVAAAASGRASFHIDGAAFQTLARLVLQPLAERIRHGRDVRVWVPGAGDGAVAYALAFEILERAGHQADLTRLRVFATDTDAATLLATSDGRLGRRAARTFLRAGFRRNLSWAGDHWTVRAPVRGRIICSLHDPIATTPFADIDLVHAHGAVAATPSTCNLCLMRQLVGSLALGGVLALDPTRAIGSPPAGLQPLDGSAGLFVRRDEAMALPAQRRSGAAAATTPPPSPAVIADRLTGHFAPAGLVVDAVGRIVATTGDAPSRLLVAGSNLAPTVSTTTAPKLRSALLLAFVTALRSERSSAEPARRAAAEGVVARRLRASPLSSEPLWLLTTTTDDHEDVLDPGEAGLLREHLVHTTQSLRRAMDELAGRNTALRNANDELQTSIDELERSNRQLAAMNTELMAVRQEHERRIDELDALNLDVENLFRASDLAMIVLDGRGRLRRYTPSAGRLFRLVRTDLGRPFTTLLPATMADLREAVRAAEGGRGPGRQLAVAFEDEAQHVSGLARIHPYETADGGHGGIILTVADVSDLKAAQESLQHQNLALTRANEDLERFAYIASHDLKSPLRSVRTMLEFLRSDLGDDLPAENREHLMLVAERVQQMECMIQDLLTYSRLGREARAPMSVAIGDVVRAQLDLLHVPEGFNVVVDPNLPTLTIDVGLFEHVVRNLLENAIRHHDRPGGRIRVGYVPGRDAPTFEVADDGPGIAVRYHQRIFEIFQKPGARADAGGSGMGLALVKKAIERNGGTIDVESADGERGTTFRFTWPERLPAQSVAAGT